MAFTNPPTHYATANMTETYNVMQSGKLSVGRS